MKNIKTLIIVIFLLLPNNVFAYFAINDSYLKDYNIKVNVDEKNILHITEQFYVQDVNDNVLLKSILLFSDTQ